MFKALKLGLVLAMFCILSAASLSYVYMLTQPIIDINAKINFENSLKEVLSSATVFNEQLINNLTTYLGENNKKNMGMAVLVSSQGYSGKIDMLVGIDQAGKIKGLKILNQFSLINLLKNL